MLARDGGDRRDRVERGGRRGPGGGDDGARLLAGGDVGLDQAAQLVRPHGESLVVRDMADVVAAEARQQRRLVDRAVRLVRAIDCQRLLFRLQAAAAGAMFCRPLARAQQGDQGVGGRSVLDHAAPGIAEAGHAAQPIGHHLFQLGERRAGLPGEAEGAEAGREIVAQHAGWQAVGGEIGEEAGMLPMRQARHDDALHVGEDGIEALGLKRRLRRQLRLDVAGLHAGHHRQRGDAGAVVRDPVDQLMAEFPELFGRHARFPTPVRRGAAPASGRRSTPRRSGDSRRR